MTNQRTTQYRLHRELDERHTIDYHNDDLVDLLKCFDLTISTAESCTGGLLGSRITDVAGSSKVYSGGIIAYSNPIKIAQLGVNPNSIMEFTEVSDCVAREMAYGVRERFNTDIGLSTTGILDFENEDNILVYCCVDSDLGSDVFMLDSTYVIGMENRGIMKDRICRLLLDKAYRHAENLN